MTDFVLIVIGLLLAGGPLLACIVHQLRNGRWPWARWVPLACYFWGLVVGELYGRCGLYSPCAFLIWFAVAPVLLVWLLLTPGRPRS